MISDIDIIIKISIVVFEDLSNIDCLYRDKIGYRYRQSSIDTSIDICYRDDKIVV